MTALVDPRRLPSSVFSRPELIEGVRDCEYVWMLGDTPIDAEVIEAAPGLKGIATMALFPNVVDVEAATARKLPVTVVPHVITRTTCDLTLAHILHHHGIESVVIAIIVSIKRWCWGSVALGPWPRWGG